MTHPLTLVLGLTCLCLASSGSAVAEDSARVASTSSTPTLWVRVDEYELPKQLDSKASPKAILELIEKSGVKETVACGVTAVCGVPTRTRYTRRMPVIRSVTTGPDNSKAKSYQYLVIETRVDVLVTEHDGGFKVDLKYESSGHQKASTEDALPGEAISDIDSSYLMKPGDLQLCGMSQREVSKVITIRLLE